MKDNHEWVATTVTYRSDSYVKYLCNVCDCYYYGGAAKDLAVVYDIHGRPVKDNDCHVQFVKRLIEE